MLVFSFCLMCGESFGHVGLLVFKTGQNKESKSFFPPSPTAPGCTSMQILLSDPGSQLSCCKPNVLTCTAEMNRITPCQFSKLTEESCV